MNKHVNLKAYDNFESLENLGDRLEEYRKSKLDSAKGHVAFIKNCFPNKRITMLELGSGNSKTLYALEKAGVLKKGYGIEISKSRFEFAEKWKKDWGFKLVENINADVIDKNLDDFKNIDLCLCVDLAFQHFEPVGKKDSLEILKDIYRNLQLEGKIILELDGCGKVISRVQNGGVKLWEEFPPPDPWKYSLWDCKYDYGKKILKWKKIFIKRNKFGFSESMVIHRVYKKDEICGLLTDAGFKKVDLYADWEGNSFRGDASEFIIVGKK